MINIYVLNKDGSPLMPIHSYGRAKRMLRTGKADIACKYPFTLRLTSQIENPQLDTCILGNDPGRTNLGYCVIDSKGNILISASLFSRNKDVKKNLADRKTHRQMSRRGERKRRQRRAIACDKAGTLRCTEVWRILPKTKKPVRCKAIKNQEARFSHRVRKKGWLTPTAQHLLETHLNAICLLRKFVPISMAAVELNRFDFARMESPGIENWEYQQGKLAGYNNVEEAVRIQQKGRCLLCGRKKIDYCHHIIPKSEGGSDTIENRAGLCHECHYGEHGVHKDAEARGRLAKKKAGLQKKYHALSVINQIMWYYLTALKDMMPVKITTGYQTSQTRKHYTTLPEKQKDDGTHYIDAWCIAVSALDNLPETTPAFDDSHYIIRQYRRHDRAIIKSQAERTYYLDGEVVAHNRHKRTGQSDTKENYDSLAEFRHDHPKDVCRLTVKRSARRYNNLKRPLPGSIFLADDGEHMLQSTQTNGTKLWAVDNKVAYYRASECTFVKRNTGLVFTPQ